MASLLDKLKKAGTVSAADILSKSVYFVNKETIHTDLPILNVAFSGSFSGGLTSGVTIIAGPSKSFKSYLSIYCMEAYLKKYEDAICLFYDSEFGIPVAYMESLNIDTNRVLHIPVTNLEELSFDLVNRLEQIERGDKVFILVDSIGNLASKKEYDNALSENSAKDMTRAQSLKSFFRIITPHIVMKDLNCVIVNHTYAAVGSFIPGQVVSGGSGPQYSANTIFVISKSQEKSGSDLIGWNYTITIDKSRFVKEKSKLTFQVLYDQGINKYSGLLDLALESGNVIKPSQGWYSRVNKSTGEVEDKKYREKDTYNEDFWNQILEDESFNNYVERKYQLGKIQIDANKKEENE